MAQDALVNSGARPRADTAPDRVAQLDHYEGLTSTPYGPMPLS